LTSRCRWRFDGLSKRPEINRTTLVLIAVIGVVAAVFIRRAGRPVGQLYAGPPIAEGSLTRASRRGRHELAWLAEAFNHMAADSKRAAEVNECPSDWSEKVVEKRPN
jgi:hypothetical protein